MLELAPREQLRRSEIPRAKRVTLSSEKKASYEQIEVSPAEWTEFGIYMPTAGNIQRFSFRERRYLKDIYNTPANRVLLMAGRQVEKSVCADSMISMYDGSLKRADEVSVGEYVATMGGDGSSMQTGCVTWKSHVYQKTCLRIHTRQGHFTDVATTHPMRTWNSWAEAGSLSVGDRLAVVRRAGIFDDTPWAPNDELVAFTAYMIGDGSVSSSYASFTAVPGPVLSNFLYVAKRLSGEKLKIYPKKKTDAVQVRMKKAKLWRTMADMGLAEKGSYDKFVPDWVFSLTRRQAALFLNRLWSTDGHVKQNTRSKYSMEYCSVSYTLARQVQSLLWKFGIPSKIRENWPNYWKKRGREDKRAYILRIETQEGSKRFITEIGVLGKGSGAKVPKVKSNNNRDTYPKDGVTSDIHAILRSYGEGWHKKRKSSLHKSGLRRTPKHPLTRGKLSEYVEFFRRDGRYDCRKVEKLAAHVDTDLYWDVITKIEYLGVQDCVDFTVDDTSNFVCNGFVTHNSTSIGNMILAYSSIIPFFKTLYVSPSHQQTKVFSRDRIKEPIDLSPKLSAFTNQKLLSNILEKKFMNGSQITLRFAFLNADRCRGLAADLVEIDEFQDILLENIPVIEECASHSCYRLFRYSGTPKTLDGPLETYWSKFSTMNEWVVPCRAHGTPKNPGSWHWNVLDEDNISPRGLVCDLCGKPIDPADEYAQWASMQPHPRATEPFVGYRIPQLMVPWIRWGDILHKQKTYSRAKFYNEVLGRSYDSGTRPLTRQDVMDNCWDELSMSHAVEIGRKYSGQVPIFMGIDWGSGENTYTVAVLGAYLPLAPDRFTIFYAHRFEGLESEPKVQLEVINRLINQFNVRYIGVDYGGGFWPNDELVRNYGADRLKRYQWVGNVKKKLSYEGALGVPRFLAHRTEVMSDYFNSLKRRDVFLFPRWEEFYDPFAIDHLNVFSEYNERLKLNVYKHSHGCPDDTVHANIFCFLASFFHKPRYDVISPTRELDRAAEEAAAYEGINELDILSSPYRPQLPV